MALLDNLVSYWKLDEASGNALDSHGSNTLTDRNTVGSAVGKINNGRDFELDNLEMFSVADNAALSAGDTDFTVAGWVKAESLVGNNTIVAKYNVTGNQREYWLRYDSGTFTWLVSGDGATTTTRRANNFGAASVGVFYHVVAWHDSFNNEIGISVNAGTPNTVAHTTGVFNGSAEFCIGGRNPAASVDFWDGVIDEVGFWRRVLTSEERTALYNAGSGLAYSSFSTTYNETPSGGIAIGGSAAARVTPPIYNTRAPADAPIRKIIFLFDNTEHRQYCGQSAGHATTSIQFLVTAGTKAETMDLRDRMQETLSGFSGMMGLSNVYEVRMTGCSEMVERSKRPKVFEQVITFEFGYEEPRPFCQFDHIATTEEFEVALVNYLSPLADIYHAEFPTTALFAPAIIYRRTDGDDINYCGGTTSIDRTYELICLAPTKREVITLREILRSKLDGLSGRMGAANVMYMSLEAETDDYEIRVASVPVYAIRHTYECKITPE